MEKFVSIVLALVLALTCIVAFAEEAETASPELTVAVEVLNAVPEGFALVVTPIEEAGEAAVEIYNAVVADPAAAFGDLGGTYNLDEMFAVDVAGYKEDMGDATVALTVPTEYADDAQVVVELAVAGEGFVALPATVQNGAVIVTIP